MKGLEYLFEYSFLSANAMTYYAYNSLVAVHFYAAKFFQFSSYFFQMAGIIDC